MLIVPVVIAGIYSLSTAIESAGKEKAKAEVQVAQAQLEVARVQMQIQQEAKRD